MLTLLDKVREIKWGTYICKFIPFILVFLIGLFCGYRLMPTKTVTKYETKVETKYVEVEGKHTTEVQYVYKDSPKDADVSIKT